MLNSFCHVGVAGWTKEAAWGKTVHTGVSVTDRKRSAGEEREGGAFPFVDTHFKPRWTVLKSVCRCHDNISQHVFMHQIHNLEEQLEQFREELENKSEEVQQLHMQLEIQRKEIISQQEYLETRDSMLQVNSRNATRILTTCCVKPPFTLHLLS